MNITPSIRSITEYAMKLSEQDALEAVADPAAFGARLAEQLRAAGVAPAMTSNGHKAHKPRIKMGKINRLKARAAKSGAVCPECGKTLTTEGMLARHLRQKHGHAAPASAAPSSSAP